MSGSERSELLFLLVVSILPNVPAAVNWKLRPQLPASVICRLRLPCLVARGRQFEEAADHALQ
ncbi:MAG: hypothetical protein WDA02_08315, partial [Saccharofermentanales bacterium]